jgi:hypothetical protein
MQPVHTVTAEVYTEMLCSTSRVHECCEGLFMKTPALPCQSSPRECLELSG